VKVVSRADSSTLIGQGHVIHFVTLGRTVRAHGAEISFVCRERLGHLCNQVVRRAGLLGIEFL